MLHPSFNALKSERVKLQTRSLVLPKFSKNIFPYIWNEIRFTVAYESDLEFVEQTMQRVAEEELGEAMLERVHTYTALLAETPVDQLQVRERSGAFLVCDGTNRHSIVRRNLADFVKDL